MNPAMNNSLPEKAGKHVVLNRSEMKKLTQMPVIDENHDKNSVFQRLTKNSHPQHRKQYMKFMR